MLNIHRPGRHGSQNSRLLEAAKALDVKSAEVFINTKGCAEKEGPPNCNLCQFGCPTGCKMSGPVTTLQMAQETGNCKIVTNVTVDRILFNDEGRATGVMAYHNESGRSLVIKARRVVCACGSMQTPPLLLRSGLKARIPILAPTYAC